MSCSLVYTQDDKYVLTAMSVDYPPCPPVEGVPRAQVNESTKTKWIFGHAGAY